MSARPEHTLDPITVGDDCTRCNKSADVTLPFMPMPWMDCGYARCRGALCLRWVGKSTRIDIPVVPRKNKGPSTERH